MKGKSDSDNIPFLGLYHILRGWISAEDGAVYNIMLITHLSCRNRMQKPKKALDSSFIIALKLSACYHSTKNPHKC